MSGTVAAVAAALGGSSVESHTSWLCMRGCNINHRQAAAAQGGQSQEANAVAGERALAQDSELQNVHDIWRMVLMVALSTFAHPSSADSYSSSASRCCKLAQSC